MVGNQTKDEYKTRRSGDYLPTMYIGLVDKYGQIVGVSENEKLTISIGEETEISKYKPVLGGKSEYYSSYGIFVIDNVEFTGTPGQKYQVFLKTDAIDIDKPSNKEYLQSQ